MECISDMLIPLLSGAATTGAETKRDFQSKDKGETKMKNIKTKSLK